MNLIVKKICIFFGIILLLLHVCDIYIFADSEGIVAIIFGENITYKDIEVSGANIDTSSKIELTLCSIDTPIDKLRKIIYIKIANDFIDRNGLNATLDEINELKAWLDWSREKDLKDYERDLLNIENRLKSSSLDFIEKKSLKKKRKSILKSINSIEMMEKYQLSDRQLGDAYAPWIEMWKLNKRLYNRYGGVIIATKFGPKPIGAIKSMLKEYRKRGYFRILDKKMKKQFWNYYKPNTECIMSQEEVSFIPFWKYPIPEEFLSEIGGEIGGHNTNCLDRDNKWDGSI